MVVSHWWYSHPLDFICYYFPGELLWVSPFNASSVPCLFQFVNGEVASFQTGKFNMSDSFQDWSCSSACSPPQHCHLPRCTKVPFPETFTGLGKASPPITWVRTEGD